MRRAGYGLLAILAAVVAAFALLHAAPGGLDGGWGADPTISGNERELARADAGGDLAWPARCAHWLWAAVHLDLGTSLVTGRPVVEMVSERLPATLELMGAAMLLAMVLALTIGAICTHWQGRAPDRLLSGVTLAVMAMPGFWLGLLAIGLFAVRLGLMPAGGRTDAAAPGGFWDHFQHLLMPAGVLGLVLGARWSRHMRAALVEAAQAVCLRVARSRGLPSWRVFWRHTVRPALPALVTVVAVESPALFSGALLTETVFGWPGMGRLFHDGLQRRDEPRILAILVLTSGLIVLFNLLADGLQRALDPRARDHAET